MADEKIIFSMVGVSKTFTNQKKVLNNIYLSFFYGAKIGIIGLNGAGKSTLMKIIAGIDKNYQGEVVFSPGYTVGYLEQEPKLDDTKSVREVVEEGCAETVALLKEYEEINAKLCEPMSDDEMAALIERQGVVYEKIDHCNGWELDSVLERAMDALRCPDPDENVKHLSGGERRRVALCRLLLQQPDVLLLDEPTNHLDMHAVEWLEGYIEKFKGTVLTISHDRYFLDRVVTRIVELHDGKAEFYSGNYSFYVQEKQARFELQLKQYEKEQAKLAQLGFTLERMKGWGINNRTLYRRAMSIQHRMERIEKTDRPTQDKTMRAKFAQRDFFGDEVLSVKGLGKAYDGRTLFSDVELQVAGGERIALLGDNGTGKSTFLKILLGEEAGAGRIKFGPTVKWAYLPQIIHFAHPERTLLDTMLYEKNCTVQTARDRLGAYLFEGEDVFKTVGSLSGGEQSRLRLCMLMDEKINLLVLDEPTNHLDIDSREWLEDALEDYEGTLIFVSHDRYFVNKFATRIWELENGQIRDYLCGYEKYRSIKEKEAIAAPAPEKPKKEHKEKPKTSGSKMLEKKVRALEREIEKQEALSAELDAKIEAAAADYQELARLMEEKQQAEDTLAQMMEQWEALSCELEDAT